jgi:signal peptidase I
MSEMPPVGGERMAHEEPRTARLSAPTDAPEREAAVADLDGADRVPQPVDHTGRHAEDVAPGSGTSVSTVTGESAAGGDVAEDEEDDEAEDGPGRRLGFVRELVETVLLTLVIFVAVRTVVVNYQVEGDSMRPNLHNGQYLLVNKAVYFHFDLNRLRNLAPGPDSADRDIVYLFHRPERGDIVVFDPPERSDKPYVKRVIAVEGETVAFREGRIYVNGKVLNEAYIVGSVNPAPFGGAGNDREVTVPANAVYVLGDNRNNSKDSRYFGAVSLDEVVGKAFISYWPPDDAGLIPHERYAQADGE